MNKILIFLLAFSVLTSCDFSVSVNKDNVDEGFKLLEEGNYTSAEGEFKHALFLDSSKTEAYRGLALCYLFTEKYDVALYNANKYISFNQTDPRGFNDRGTIYLHQRAFSKAISDFDMVIQLDTSAQRAIAVYNKANALYALKDYKQAADNYSIVLNYNPKDAACYIARGLTRKQMNQKDSACLDLRIAIELGAEENKELASFCSF